MKLLKKEFKSLVQNLLEQIYVGAGEKQEGTKIFDKKNIKIGRAGIAILWAYKQVYFAKHGIEQETSIKRKERWLASITSYSSSDYNKAIIGKPPGSKTLLAYKICNSEQECKAFLKMYKISK